MAAPKKSTAKEAGQEKGQEKGNGSPPEFSREQELKALRDMLLIRRFEEKAGQLYGMGAIGGFCHLYIGQEAVVVGMQMALKQGDQVITGYRDHGHMLACGMDAKGVMAELTGRRGGYSKRGASFNIPGQQIDGMDVRAVKAAGDEAVAWCRAGKGPFILEMQTYRYRGHSMSDPAKYRTREEVEKIRTDQDPIEQVRNRLLAAKVSEQELKSIDAEVREIVNAAADFAQRDPEPDPSELWTDVYK